MQKYTLRICYGQFKISFYITVWLSILLLALTIFNRIYSIKYQIQLINTVKRNSIKSYDPRDSPFIFIGGHQSTGTGLMRILLDIHPLVRCGPEPIVTREMLRYRRHLEGISNQLLQSGITDYVLDDSTAAFIATVIQKMGPQAERLCHKDPSSFLYLEELADIFPKAKFIHMIRDGRAAIASTIHRGIHPYYTLENVTAASFAWERTTSKMSEDCQYIGISRCLPVRYECLILNPRDEIKKVLDFLELPWDDKLLEHEKFVNNTSMLNKYEASSIQIVKSMHNQSLDAWSRNDSAIPMEFFKFISDNSTLLKSLGYATGEIPPNYKNICNN
ncbi:unnamed protein product [Schistosoma turkestanicum]|nr:unnamed protein product [Schistosoma turkestanicum]